MVTRSRSPSQAITAISIIVVLLLNDIFHENAIHSRSYTGKNNIFATAFTTRRLSLQHSPTSLLQSNEKLRLLSDHFQERSKSKIGIQNQHCRRFRILMTSEENEEEEDEKKEELTINEGEEEIEIYEDEKDGDEITKDVEGEEKEEEKVETVEVYGADISEAAANSGFIDSIRDEYGLGSPCVIKVLGVGGGGGNAVNRMIETLIEGVTFWAINTDAQALTKSLAPNILNIGRETTRGLGAGGVPDVGMEAALENTEEIRRICEGADLVFIAGGMGGGTGSGAAPIVAEIARDQCGCLTIGVVTKPFMFEGRKRMRQAEDAISKLKQNVDTLIVVSNDKLLQIVPDATPMKDAFSVADDILRQGVVGISEIIIKTGIVNLDFADVRTIMKSAGTALMGVGTGSGKMRTRDAAVAAISSPLLEFPINRAGRILFNVVGGEGLLLHEVRAAAEVIYENADENANIIFGAFTDGRMSEEVTITVLAAGFADDPLSMSSEDAAAAKQKERVAIPPSLRSLYGESAVALGESATIMRSPNFYKDRRKLTRSPLGDTASLEETRRAINRGTFTKIKSKKEEGKETGSYQTNDSEDANIPPTLRRRKRDFLLNLLRRWF